MNRLMSVCVAVAATAVVGSPAHAFTFTLTPVTNTTSTFAGTILIQGSVTLSPGETFFNPAMMSTVHLPFLAGFTAGFNGSGQAFDPGFLAWNGVGSYTGPIYNHQISTNNLGYSGGMPLGLYGSNLLGPGGQSAIVLNYADGSGITRSAVATYAINVVPAPGGVLALLTLGGLASRRSRE